MAEKERRLYIAGNWKMHKTSGEARTLAAEVAKAVGGSSRTIMIAPPFTALAAVRDALDSSRVRLGAQNMACEESGAHTGEIAPAMLTDLGVETVILGHSERRAIYGEDDTLINRKVRLARAHGLEVILCVGETIEQREAGEAETVVSSQLEQGLAGVEELSGVVVAYEPVWAIGTGRTASPSDANAMHALIRSNVESWYDRDAAEALIIQYGGSVKPGNAAELLSQQHIDGALVGGASLEADSFVAIVRALE